MTQNSLGKIERVLSWLKNAKLELQRNPNSNLHDFTYPGPYGWSREIAQIYYEPATVEEKFLQGAIHDVILISLENSFQIAAAVEYNGKWGAWNGIQITETFRIAQMVVGRDPGLACDLKVRLNDLCLLAGETLENLANENFGLLIRKPGVSW